MKAVYPKKYATIDVCHILQASWSISFIIQQPKGNEKKGFRNLENDIRNLKEKESNSTFKIRHSELKKGLKIPKTSCLLEQKNGIWIRNTVFGIRKNN